MGSNVLSQQRNVCGDLGVGFQCHENPICLGALWEHSGRCTPAQLLLVLLRAPESSWMLIMKLGALWEHSGRCTPAQLLLVLLRAPESSWMLIMKSGALLEHSGDVLLLHCSWELLTNI